MHTYIFLIWAFRERLKDQVYGQNTFFSLLCFHAWYSTWYKVDTYYIFGKRMKATFPSCRL